MKTDAQNCTIKKVTDVVTFLLAKRYYTNSDFLDFLADCRTVV